MRAAFLKEIGKPLQIANIETPQPSTGELLVKVIACGVCRTDLHIVDGDLPETRLPIIPGHQVVGEVVELQNKTSRFYIGQRVGIPWLGSTCGQCDFCLAEQENLCDSARFTGYHLDGGFAEYCLADEQFCFLIPEQFESEQAAPLLCAGLIGYRSYQMLDNAETIGFYGFGAAAHLLIQLACYQNRKIYAFTREGDKTTQSFACKMGAEWAGSSDEIPPRALDAAIIFAPVGNLVPKALRAVRKGGIVVCAGIHMSKIPSFSYDLLWGERTIRSVANLTRRDGEEFLDLVAQVPVQSEVQLYKLDDVNQAIKDIRQGRINGSAVISFS